MRKVTTIIVGGMLAMLSGCALSDTEVSQMNAGDPPTVHIRFHVADSEPQDGYHVLPDERGQPLYLAPTPFLTDADVCDAAAMIGERRNLLAVEFCPLAAERFEHVVRDHRQQRLAVFVNDELIMSPTMPTPSATGRIILDGDFSQKRVRDLARGLDAQRKAIRRSTSEPNQ
jgi:preprotein translocase subunit SecD